MGLKEIVAALDDEIGRLQQVRTLLAGTKGIRDGASLPNSRSRAPARVPFCQRMMACRSN
jgi:hypothetical protein